VRRSVATRKQDAHTVRRRAEKLWSEQQTVRSALPRGAALIRLTRELEVHQIELELQNEQLREARQALETNYNELYDFAPVGYFTFDHLGIIRRANLTGTEMLGLNRPALIGKRFVQFVVPGVRKKFHALMREARQRKEGRMLTLMKASEIGLEVSVDVYIEVAPINGELAAVVVDITSTRQAELATRQTQQRLNLAVAATNVGVWIWEFASANLYWSEVCGTIFGTDQICVTLDTVKKVLHPDYAPRVMTLFRETPDKAAPCSLEFRIIRPDGKVAWIQSMYEIQYDLDGNPTAVVGTAQDITSGKQRDEDLRHVEEDLRHVLAEKEALLRQIPHDIRSH
jgi:PAS domain S-box-containing protein